MKTPHQRASAGFLMNVSGLTVCGKNTVKKSLKEINFR